MYPSANLVAFVNVEDFRHAILSILKEFKKQDSTLKQPEAATKYPLNSVYLAVSYDTDLIAFHNIIPYLDYFYDFFAAQPDLFVEIRTKSANQTFYKNHNPLENIIFAFTLSPEKVVQKYERCTPSLKLRIKAIQTAITEGFKVRLCFDPIFINDDIDALYEPFYNYIFNELNLNKIVDVGYGFFRMPKEFYKRIQKRQEKQQSNSQLFCEEYCINEDVVSYSKDLQEKVQEEHYKLLTKYIQKERIFSL